MSYFSLRANFANKICLNKKKKKKKKKKNLRQHNSTDRMESCISPLTAKRKHPPKIIDKR